MLQRLAVTLFITTTPIACGDDDANPGPTGGAGGSGTGAIGGGGMGGGGMGGGGTGGGGSGGAPPTECIASDDTVLAADRLYFGDTNWDGSPNLEGWKQYGMNLDGLVTTTDFTGHCQPQGNAPPGAVHQDGDAGIDNSFGQNLVPILAGFAPDFSGQMAQAIQNGEFTYIVKLDDLGPEADQAGVLAKLYLAGPLGAPAALDGGDCWPVVPEGLSAPRDIESTTTFFETGDLAGNQWTSPDTITFALQISFAGYRMQIPIQHARMQLELDDAHEAASSGVLAGVVPVEAFIAEFKKLAGSISQELCQGSTFDSIADQIRQNADIMDDGTQDPNATCNAISIGVGFTAVEASLGGIAPPARPEVDPCAP